MTAKTPKQGTWRSAWLRGRDGAVRLKSSGRSPERRRSIAQYELRALRSGKDRRGRPLAPLTRAAKRGAVYQFTVQGDLGRNPTRDPNRKGSRKFFGPRTRTQAKRPFRGGNKARAAFAGR